MKLNCFELRASALVVGRAQQEGQTLGGLLPGVHGLRDGDVTNLAALWPRILETPPNEFGIDLNSFPGDGRHIVDELAGGRLWLGRAAVYFWSKVGDRWLFVLMQAKLSLTPIERFDSVSTACTNGLLAKLQFDGSMARRNQPVATFGTGAGGFVGRVAGRPAGSESSESFASVRPRQGRDWFGSAGQGGRGRAKWTAADEGVASEGSDRYVSEPASDGEESGADLFVAVTKRREMRRRRPAGAPAPPAEERSSSRLVGGQLPSNGPEERAPEGAGLVSKDASELIEEASGSGGRHGSDPGKRAGTPASSEKGRPGGSTSGQRRKQSSALVLVVLAYCGTTAQCEAAREEAREVLGEIERPEAPAGKPKEGQDAAARQLAEMKTALNSGDVVFATVVDWRAFMGPVLGVHFDLDLQDGVRSKVARSG
jgi:hypothetical protein